MFVVDLVMSARRATKRYERIPYVLYAAAAEPSLIASREYNSITACCCRLLIGHQVPIFIVSEEVSRGTAALVVQQYIVFLVLVFSFVYCMGSPISSFLSLIFLFCPFSLFFFFFPFASYFPFSFFPSLLSLSFFFGLI